MDSLTWDEFDATLLSLDSKIIHQIWFGTYPTRQSAAKIREELNKYEKTWINRNPDWLHVVWDTRRCRELIRLCYPQHQPLYEGYRWDIQRCDAARYFFLHRYGGLYSDMDYVCHKPWTEVVVEYPHKLYLVETPNKMSSALHVSNSLMFSSVQKHTFWSRLFIEMERCKKVPVYYSRHMEIMYTTGPGILNKTFNVYERVDKLCSYPAKLFHPYGITSENLDLGRAVGYYAVHLGKGSWEGKDSKIALFVYLHWRILVFIILVMSLPWLVRWIVLRTVVAEES
jgi:inositol phosphorylceramide mannosyltransferase catalytic subunit